MKKSKVIGIILGVVLFSLVVAGLTYAWLVWRSSNTLVEGKSACFNINYEKGAEIGTTDESVLISMVSDYSDADFAEVSLALDSECNKIAGKATIYLNTNIDKTDITMLSGALKYTIVEIDSSGNELAVLSDGIVNSTDKITLLDNIEINSTDPVWYRIYIWLDGELTDNSYANLNYSGYISAEAVSTNAKIIKKKYEDMTPKEKLMHDVNLTVNWFEEQRMKELNGEDTNEAYSTWIENMGGSFPTCPSSSEDDLINCFVHFNEYGDFDPDDSIGEEILDILGLKEKGIQTNSYHSMAFMNVSTNKLCVILKINKSGGSYYEEDYTTDFGNIRYMMSAGCK